MRLEDAPGTVARRIKQAPERATAALNLTLRDSLRRGPAHRAPPLLESGDIGERRLRDALQRFFGEEALMVGDSDVSNCPFLILLANWIPFNVTTVFPNVLNPIIG